jgi:hypothetical protein
MTPEEIANFLGLATITSGDEAFPILLATLPKELDSFASPLPIIFISSDGGPSASMITGLAILLGGSTWLMINEALAGALLAAAGLAVCGGDAGGEGATSSIANVCMGSEFG